MFEVGHCMSYLTSSTRQHEDAHLVGEVEEPVVLQLPLQRREAALSLRELLRFCRLRLRPRPSALPRTNASAATEAAAAVESVSSAVDAATSAVESESESWPAVPEYTPETPGVP